MYVEEKLGVKKIVFAIQFLLVLVLISVGAALIYLIIYMSKIQDIADHATPELWEIGDGRYQ